VKGKAAKRVPKALRKDFSPLWKNCLMLKNVPEIKAALWEVLGKGRGGHYMYVPGEQKQTFSSLVLELPGSIRIILTML